MNTETWWKVEPCSPHGSDSPTEWSLQDYNVEVEVSNEYQQAETEENGIVPNRAILAQQLLDDLEDYIKPEEETFSNWFEEKVPIFNDVLDTESVSTVATTELAGLTSLVSTAPTLIQPSFYFKEQDDFSLALGHGHLTPPQSPPTFAPFQPSYATLVPSQALYNQDTLLLETQSPELAHEMAVVDAVVRGVAEQWEELELTDTSSRASDTTANDATDDTDDPEWEPASPAKPKNTGRSARQPRPYKVQDRRQRKKEQNKNAAIRYRQKKKAEVTSVVEEEREHEVYNNSLNTKVTDLQREISYLKGLMRDMFRAKGLIS